MQIVRPDAAEKEKPGSRRASIAELRRLPGSYIRNFVRLHGPQCRAA